MLLNISLAILYKSKNKWLVYCYTLMDMHPLGCRSGDQWGEAKKWSSYKEVQVNAQSSPQYILYMMISETASLALFTSMVIDAANQLKQGFCIVQ